MINYQGNSMITVNDRDYAAFGGYEEFKKWQANHETFDFVNERVAYLDFIEQTILLDFLSHFHEDFIPNDILKAIYDEITTAPLTPLTPQIIRDKVNEIEVEHSEAIDEEARRRIAQLEDSISQLIAQILDINSKLNDIFDTIDQQGKQIINLESFAEANKDKITQNTEAINELTVRVEDLEDKELIINALTQTVRELKQIVLNNASQINTLQSDVKELNKKIDNCCGGDPQPIEPQKRGFKDTQKKKNYNWCKSNKYEYNCKLYEYINCNGHNVSAWI